MMKNYKLLVAIAGIGAALLFAAYPVRAQLAKEKVDELDGVGITEKLKDIAVIEQMPKQEGKMLFSVVAPARKHP